MSSKWLHYSGRMVTFFTDKTIVFSFDKTGFLLHKLSFSESDLNVDLSGQVAVVTGANSGMGFATTRFLASRGVRVHMLCRNRRRGLDAIETIRSEIDDANLTLHVVDVSSLSSIHEFVNRYSESHLDIMIHNAGVLPSERILTNDGLELTWATNILGPFLMTHLMLPQLKNAKRARVIYVSSGGMYPQKLDLEDLNWDTRVFDGVRAYANSKRAMVIVNELMAEKYTDTPIRFHAMHPGWADTPAVKTSIPTFYRVTKAILRTPEQGADTIKWLAAAESPQDSSGRFWFDRKQRKTHLLPGTRETETMREQLWELLVRQAQLRNEVDKESL